MKKAPGEFDRQVGRRVRARRIQSGMSQERLADQIGVTFQQVQKYEKGTNRIPISRLRTISQIFVVPLNYFTEGPLGEDGSTAQPGFAEQGQTGYSIDILASPEGVALVRAFSSIEDPKLRRRVVDLVTTLVEGQKRP